MKKNQPICRGEKNLALHQSKTGGKTTATKLKTFKLREFTLNLACEIDVVYTQHHNNFDGIVVRTSGDAVEVSSQVFRNNRMRLQEQVVVTYLNNQNTVLGTMNVGTGTATACLMDIKTIFSAALRVGAVKLIVFHNHPSGILKPSTQDERLTLRLSQAAQLLDMKLLDHIIVNADYDYFSFSDSTGLLED